MRKQTVLTVGVSVGLCVAASAFPANASSVTLVDNYYGALSTYGGMTGDTIEAPGTHNFEISSAIISRSGVGNNTLNITINTNFAGVPGTPAADKTGYGSLFLTPGVWNPQGGGGPSYQADQYVPNEWAYAVTMLKTPATASVGTTSSGLYAIGNVTGTNYYTANGANGTVVQTYTTANGTVVMSNVDNTSGSVINDPVTYPGAGQPGFYFRQGQAVQYTPANPASIVAGTSATWAVDAVLKTITYTIVDNGIFGNSFALAWAMTCANDVIQGQVTLPPDAPPTATPLPAAFSMFAGGLGVLGFLGSRRRKKRIAKAV